MQAVPLAALHPLLPTMLAAAAAAAGALVLLVVLLLAYLVRLNQVLLGTPDEVRKLAPTRWTRELLAETYRRLEARPITPERYAARIPPKLERRYVVTGGSGLVGSYLVQQLLARGQPASSIRIIDLRPPEHDGGGGAANPTGSNETTQPAFVQADISSAAATRDAFAAPWPAAVAHLPLTVFHTAAVIVPSDRSPRSPAAAFCDAVNERGTQHVLAAARAAGADVLVSTTSASIAIRPVGLWVAPWRLLSSSSSSSQSTSAGGPWPRGFWQVLDERDFFAPLRPRGAFYACYPASKAAAERAVCDANGPEMRTGCVRPANGVYGNPTDNTLGGTLAKAVLPTWMSHIVQSFAHGVNVAVAHLDFEAVLASSPDAAALPQAGRPFVVTDPNPPITYGDLYFLVQTLAATPLRVVRLQPVAMVLLSYPIEWYSLALARWPGLRRVLPELAGEARHLQPGIFSICTHLVASNEAAGRPVAGGGLGYTGVLTTLEGMVQEVAEWNREHRDAGGARRSYQTSLSLADEIAKAAAAVTSVASS